MPTGPRIVLISPKGPLYRHRGGIFKKSLRYMPLTLTTLAALVPEELEAEVRLIDEGIEDVAPEAIEADLVGLTVITGTALARLRAGRRLRGRGHPRGARRAARDAGARRRPAARRRHRRRLRRGDAGPSCCATSRPAACAALRPAPRPLASPACPSPGATCCRASGFLTDDVFEATRGCVHNCDFCVVPSAWGRKPYQKPVEDVVADIRQKGARKLIFVDLNLIADRDYAARLFAALIPLERAVVRPRDRAARPTTPSCSSSRSGAAAKGMLMGLESISPENLRDSKKGFNSPERYHELVERLHRHGIALQGCFVFGLDDDTPDVFLETARFAVEAQIDLPRFAVVTPFPGTALYQRLESEGRILTRNWELYDGQHVVFQPAQMSVEELQRGIETAWKHAYSVPSMRAAPGRLARARWPVRIGTNLGYRFYAHNLHRFYNCDWIMGAGSGEAGRMRLTLVHPCIGRRAGDRSYIRTWQMEPLPPALIAGPDAAGRRGALLRRPDGGDPLRRADRSRGALASRPTPPSAPTRSPASTGGAACRW